MKSNVEVFDGDDDVPIVERVAAVDVAKASGMICTRVPHATITGRRVTRVWQVSATTNTIMTLADELVAVGVERVVVESTSDYWRAFVYLFQAAIIDEAHLLTPQQLEEIRLLTSADMDSSSPFAGILVGQPTLARQLRMGTFAALDQRIATRYQLKPMDIADSAGYLRHHLSIAGRDEPLFADDAIARLHRAANGLPRQLNNAATAALIAAATAGQHLVDDTHARKAAAELTRD